jgi:hypothetical protein
MRTRDQLIGAVTLVVATYFGVMRIAEAKCDAAVGSRALPIDESHPDDLAAFRSLQQQLTLMGQAEFAERLESLRVAKELWVAPGLGPDRWAAYVEALGLVRRIYIRRVALLDPLAQLYPRGAPATVPHAEQAAFAWLSLGGAMRHELAHRDGAIEEAPAYAVELGWYEEVRRSDFMRSLEDGDRAVWEWAIDSAAASARKAARLAGVSTR